MRKIKNIQVTLLCVIFMFAIFQGLTGKATAGYASSEVVYTAQDYTNDDRLLLNNGAVAEEKIQDFAEEVKEMEEGAVVHDLGKVIPLYYLEGNYTEPLQYNGIDYGFYAVKENDFFDILLIDFIYEFENNEMNVGEYVVKVKPIMQQSFKRELNSNNTFRFIKYSGRPLYYVYNPRFMSIVQNENALNYGDDGYDKLADEGTIIRQARLNYSEILYTTEQDKLAYLLEYSIDKFSDSVDEYIIDTYLPFPINAIAKEIKERVNETNEFYQGLYEKGKDIILEANNEENIFTLPDKLQQKADASKPSYSKRVGIKPGDYDNMVLSADGSYAEMVTQLEYLQERTRLYQVCEFDIVKRESSMYADIQHIEGNWFNDEEKSLQFSKERVLFGETHQTNIEVEDCNGVSQTPLYIMPNGNQKVTFTPEYSGKYKIALSHNLSLAVDGVALESENNIYEITLTGGVTHNFVISNNTTAKQVGAYITVDFAGVVGQTAGIGAGESYIFRYVANADGYLDVMANNENCSVKLLDDAFNVIEESSTDSLTYCFGADATYYVVVTNTTQVEQFCTTNVTELPLLVMGQTTTVTAVNGASRFVNEHDEDVQYKLKLSWGQNAGEAFIYNEQGQLLAVGLNAGQVTTYTFGLEQGEQCYIIFNYTDGSISYNFDYGDNYVKWIITWEYDGEEYQIITSAAEIELQRNTVYNVVAATVIDNQIVKEAEEYARHEFNSNFAFGNNTLTIKPEAVVGQDYEIIESYGLIYEHTIIINVALHREEVPYTVTFDFAGGIKGTSSVTAHYKSDMPTVTAPIRIGFTFLGYYYTTEDNQKIKYYNADMTSARVWDMEQDATLYAEWEKTGYVITFNFDGGFGGTTSITVFAGQRLPSIIIPQKDGCEFYRYKGSDGNYYYEYSNGVLNLDFYNYEGNMTMTAQWKYPIHLELDTTGKNNSGQWRIIITNNMQMGVTVEYNSKMCYFNDAKNWTGLRDISYVFVEAGGSETVNISTNIFATSITVSFVYNGYRYVTYADNLNTNGTLRVYTNVIKL